MARFTARLSDPLLRLDTRGSSRSACQSRSHELHRGGRSRRVLLAVELISRDDADFKTIRKNLRKSIS